MRSCTHIEDRLVVPAGCRMQMPLSWWTCSRSSCQIITGEWLLGAQHHRHQLGRHLQGPGEHHHRAALVQRSGRPGLWLKVQQQQVAVIEQQRLACLSSRTMTGLLILRKVPGARRRPIKVSAMFVLTSALCPSAAVRKGVSVPTCILAWAYYRAPSSALHIFLQQVQACRHSRKRPRSLTAA